MDAKDVTTRGTHIDWHSAFYDAVQMELAQDRRKLQFEREHPLNLEPFRPDVIIIKKPPDAVLHQKFAGIFRGYNILEFKSPEDSLSVSDYIKTFSYPCIYQQEANVSYLDVTLTLIRNAEPRALLKYLKTVLKREVDEKSPGIFIVSGEMFPVQVLAGGKLPENENIWLRNLNKDRLSVRALQKMSALKRDVGKEINMDAYFSVLFSAKENLLEEVEDMGRTSLAEVIEDMGFRQEWENQGFEKGVRTGIDNTLSVIKKLKDNISLEKIAAEFNLSIEDIIKIKSSL